MKSRYLRDFSSCVFHFRDFKQSLRDMSSAAEERASNVCLPKWSVQIHFQTQGLTWVAFPLDDIKFGPLFTFPAVAVDNCTRTPVEPAVGLCPDLNL